MESKKTFSFFSLYQEFYKNKKNPLIDFTKFEVIFSVVFIIIISIILQVILKNNNADSITEIIQNILLGAGFALISLLGFIITGLSVLTSSIGYDFISELRKSSKYELIKSILFSFYYIGFIIGLTILLSLIFYIIMSIEIPINNIALCVFGAIYSYLFSFSVLYSVSLLGTCLSIFLIKNQYKFKVENEVINELNFINKKIDGLTLVLHEKEVFTKDEFERAFLRTIDTDCHEDKEEMMNRFNEYY